MHVHPPQVAAAQRNAVAIEEFQDLDCDLAAVVQAVAELRRVELTARGLRPEVEADRDHLRDGTAQKEMILRDLVELAHASQHLE